MTSIPSSGFSPPRSLSSLAKTTTGTVFVGNLSFFCNETHLRELISTYGEVRQVEVVRSRNGNSLLYGFVDFANPVDGENAVQILHRTLFMGRRIRVFWAKDEAANKVDPPQEGCTVHVSFVVHNLEVKVTEEVLYELFHQYGEIDDITIRRYYRHSKRHMQYGYAFVDYLQAGCAVAAVTTLNNAVVNGVKYDCSMSRRSSGNKADGSLNSRHEMYHPSQQPAPRQAHHAPQPLLAPGMPPVLYPSETSFSSSLGYVPSYPRQDFNSSVGFPSGYPFDQRPDPHMGHQSSRIEPTPGTGSVSQYYLYFPIAAGAYPRPPHLAPSQSSPQPPSLQNAPTFSILPQPSMERYPNAPLPQQGLPPSSYSSTFGTIAMHPSVPPTYSPGTGQLVYANNSHQMIRPPPHHHPPPSPSSNSFGSSTSYNPGSANPMNSSRNVSAHGQNSQRDSHPDASPRS